MRKLLLSLLLLTFIIACRREAATETPGTKEVWIRIKNTTTGDLNNILVGDVNYGTVVPGSITEYKLISVPVYTPWCQFKVAGHIVYAGNGICGSPPPPSFEGGYYTYRITESPTLPVYGVEMTKQ